MPAVLEKNGTAISMFSAKLSEFSDQCFSRVSVSALFLFDSDNILNLADNGL